jgi:HSP20 family protein
MNSLTKWQGPEVTLLPAFGRLLGFGNELDRLFNGPFSDWTRGSRVLSAWSPAVDLYEDKDNVTVKAELPGMKKEDINVSLEDGVLSISGERKTEKRFEGTETFRSERFVGRFQRTISLTTEVKADQVKADYKDGILTVTLPKAEEAKPKHIQINVNN